MSGRSWGTAPPDPKPKTEPSSRSWMTRPAGETAVGRKLAKFAVGLMAGVIGLFVVIAMTSASEKQRVIATPTASASGATVTKAAVDKSELAKRLTAEVKVAADAGTPWAMAVTKVECPDYCRVFYQENDLTREEIEAPARYLFLVTTPDELDTIVVQDASGRDHNVYRAKLLPAGR